MTADGVNETGPVHEGYFGSEQTITFLNEWKASQDLYGTKREAHEASVDAAIKYLETKGQYGDWKGTLYTLEQARDAANARSKAHVKKTPNAESADHLAQKDSLVGVLGQVNGEHRSLPDRAAYLSYKFSRVISGK